MFKARSTALHHGSEKPSVGKCHTSSDLQDKYEHFPGSGKSLCRDADVGDSWMISFGVDKEEDLGGLFY